MTKKRETVQQQLSELIESALDYCVPLDHWTFADKRAASDRAAAGILDDLEASDANPPRWITTKEQR